MINFNHGKIFIKTLQHIYTKSQAEIIRAVLYFDVFQYPLTMDELFGNSAVSISQKEFTSELEGLFELGCLKTYRGYVLSQGATHADVEKRLKGNRGAAEVMPVALAYSKKIAAFPFVEGVCLSGALSKNYYDEKGDIDYFIITKPGRLWICRTFLIMRYKLLPAHLKKYWCVNYFISAAHLDIDEQNAFTATELAYLLPMVNDGLYRELLQKNAWYKSRFPNKMPSPEAPYPKAPKPLLRLLLESVFSGAFGNWVDDRLLSATLKRWRKKYPSMNEEDFELQFRSRKHAGKRHTHGFQNKVLKAWEDKIGAFEQQFDADLRP